MKFLSYERLEKLREELDYLIKMKQFLIEKNQTQLVKMPAKRFVKDHEVFDEDDVPSLAKATEQALVEWKKAGLVETTTRVSLEIAFLEDFLGPEYLTYLDSLQKNN